MGDLLGVPSAGIVYGRSAAQLIYDFSRALAKQWRPGDEVVVTRLDHDANIRPWIHAAGRAADRAERPFLATGVNRPSAAPEHRRRWRAHRPSRSAQSVRLERPPLGCQR